MRHLEKNMERECRISAGAIIIREDQILLVRYDNDDGTSYLVGPGGAALTNEGASQAVVREVREETGLEVSPQKLLFVEDLLSRRYRIVKIWFLCNLVGGQLTRTQGALDEGITDVAWYGRGQLLNEVVYPPELLTYDWRAFVQNNWESKYLGPRQADF